MYHHSNCDKNKKFKMVTKVVEKMQKRKWKRERKGKKKSCCTFYSPLIKTCTSTSSSSKKKQKKYQFGWFCLKLWAFSWKLKYGEILEEIAIQVIWLAEKAFFATLRLHLT